MSKSRKYISLSDATAGVAAVCIGGNFFTGLLLLLGAKDSLVGYVSMIMVLGGTTQIFAPVILDHFPRRKTILVYAGITLNILNIVIIGIIPLLNFEESTKLTLIICTVVLISLISNLSMAGFSLLQIKNIPKKIRSKYFSFFLVFNGIINSVTLILTGVIADRFKNGGKELEGLLFLRLIAVFFAVLNIFFLLKIKEHPVNSEHSGFKSLKWIFTSSLKNRRYNFTILTSCIWIFAASFPGPFYTVYLLKDLNISYSFINGVNTLYVVMLIIFTPFWSAFIQKKSVFKALQFAMFVVIIHYIGYSFVTKETIILYPISALIGYFTMAGTNLISAQLIYENMPEKN